MNENGELQAGTYSILLKIDYLYTYRGEPQHEPATCYMLTRACYMNFPPETSQPQPKLNGVSLYRTCILCKSCVAMAEAYDIYVLQKMDRSILNPLLMMRNKVYLT